MNEEKEEYTIIIVKKTFWNKYREFMGYKFESGHWETIYNTYTIEEFIEDFLKNFPEAYALLTNKQIEENEKNDEQDKKPDAEPPIVPYYEIIEQEKTITKTESELK